MDLGRNFQFVLATDEKQMQMPEFLRKNNINIRASGAPILLISALYFLWYNFYNTKRMNADEAATEGVWNWILTAVGRQLCGFTYRFKEKLKAVINPCASCSQNDEQTTTSLKEAVKEIYMAHDDEQVQKLKDHHREWFLPSAKAPTDKPKTTTDEPKVEELMQDEQLSRIITGLDSRQLSDKVQEFEWFDEHARCPAKMCAKLLAKIKRLKEVVCCYRCRKDKGTGQMQSDVEAPRSPPLPSDPGPWLEHANAALSCCCVCCKEPRKIPKNNTRKRYVTYRHESGGTRKIVFNDKLYATGITQTKFERK
eukprot:COSAG01_NODE_3812_length_5675_cov_2.804878_2_plen_310_part_00